MGNRNDGSNNGNYVGNFNLGNNNGRDVGSSECESNYDHLILHLLLTTYISYLLLIFINWLKRWINLRKTELYLLELVHILT